MRSACQLQLAIGSLFAGTPAGATASVCIHGLIETTKANMRGPHASLRFIFEELPTATTHEEYEALLRWNVKLNFLDLPK